KKKGKLFSQPTSQKLVIGVRWSWLSFMSKHMKEKKRVASDNEGE
ncbi:unnamed protein product, partial [Brassica oleracea]